MEWREYLQTAEDAAKKAGEKIKSDFYQSKDFEKKGIRDLVTETDKQAEKIITELIKKKYPAHSILAEEETNIKKTEEYRWIIDPLDGTTNFVHSLPFVSVSIALEVDQKVVIGLVYNPVLDELFWAETGNGAYFNNKRLAVSQTKTLRDSLLTTGFAYKREGYIDWLQEVLGRFLLKCRDVRRYGSAALDLCYLAKGSYDGYYELNLNAWDVAAGSLIVSESGGKVLQILGNEFDLYKPDILATNSFVTNEMLEILKEVTKKYPIY